MMPAPAPAPEEKVGATLPVGTPEPDITSGTGSTFCSGGTAVLIDGVCHGLPEGAYCENPDLPGLTGRIYQGECSVAG